MTIYEDPDSIFRCYNHSLGEFYFAQNNRGVIDRLGREFTWRAEQIVKEFGLANVPEMVRRDFERGGNATSTRYTVFHLIEPNGTLDPDFGVPASMAYREIYWMKEAKLGQVLRVAGFNEWPSPCPRWEVTGNDAYGTGPSTDALGDIRQLQHMQKRKLQALDKLISPPVQADISLQDKPLALLPNGITYVAGAQNLGVKPIYTVNPPMQEITGEIQRLQARITEHYHNDLFRMISQLETVRSATEIDARREEKLILLGPVLDRFQNEALRPSIERIFGIMFRNGLFAPAPPEIQGGEAVIEYDSILSDARRALDAAPLERFAAFVGNIAGAEPTVLQVPDWNALVRDYGTKIGVPARVMNTEEEIAERQQQQREAEALQQAAETAKPMAESAKLLSETPVGGASDALGLMLGNQ
jgi:hypothetical protein